MIRGFFYKFNRSFKNLKNVIFHVNSYPRPENRAKGKRKHGVIVKNK